MKKWLIAFFLVGCAAEMPDIKKHDTVCPIVGFHSERCGTAVEELGDRVMVRFGFDDYAWFDKSNLTIKVRL